MCLDDAQLLLSVDIPELHNAVELAGVEKGPVNLETEDRLAVVLAQRQQLDNSAIDLVAVAVVGAVIGQPPDLDGPVASARHEHVFVGIHQDRGAPGDAQAKDPAKVCVLLNGARVDLEQRLGAGNQGVVVFGSARGRGAADGAGVEEAVLSLVGVACRLGRPFSLRILEADPLDGGCLGANVDGVALGRVDDAEDVADIVCAVDLEEADECLGAPDADDGLAGAGEEVFVVAGEEQAEDAVSVGLDGLHELVRAQGPHRDLAVAGGGEDVFVRDGDGENSGTVGQLLELLRGGVGAAVVEFAGREDGHCVGRGGGCWRFWFAGRAKVSKSGQSVHPDTNCDGSFNQCRD